MHKFYFNNECLVGNFSNHDFDELFAKSLEEFSLITEKQKSVLNGIITEKLPSDLNINSSSNLSEAIERIHNKDLKRLAFAWFRNYPIDEHFNLEVDSRLDENYTININHSNISIFYLPYISRKKGFALTVPVFEELKVDTLSLREQDGETINVNNFYGIESNSVIIENIVEEFNRESLSRIDQLKTIITSVVTDKLFDKDFSKLTIIEQDSILELLSETKSEKILFPIMPDGVKISKVNPKKEKIEVYELRVFTPTALRVYFSYSGDTLIFGMIGKKTGGNQSDDINTAHSRIYKQR